MGKGKNSQGYSLELFFKALSDPTRLRLLNLIKDGEEVCVCFFVEILKSSQPKVSRHLGFLRRAGLVKTRREGKWMHYRLMNPPDPYATRILGEVFARLSGDPAMKAECAQLVNFSCSPPSRVPAALQGAPRPISADALLDH
jgi:ArsR family transcriptional regulator